jgi:hypothetical protein
MVVSMVVGATGSGAKPALRIATSAASTAASVPSMRRLRWARRKCRPRMPSMGSTARRISDSSTVQSMVEMRKVLGATTSGWASLGVEKDGGAQHESAAFLARAGVQHASLASVDAWGAQQALSAVAAALGAQHASTAGLAVCAEQEVPAIS